MKKFIIKHKTDGSIIGTLNTKKQASDFVMKLVELNKIDNIFNVVCEEQDIDDYPLTFGDACAKLDITGSVLELQGDNNLAKSAVAFYKLAVIARAWNKTDGFTPDRSNIEQRIYYPWFVYEERVKRFVFYDVHRTTSSASAAFGSRLCFGSYSTARKFGETFTDLYNAMLL